MRARVALLAVSLVLSVGCGRIREVKGCRSLARLVNPTLADIQTHLDKDRGAVPYRYAAASYKRLSQDLRRFDIGIPRTQRSVQELSTLLNDASIQATKLADAIDQRDIVASGSARRELGHLARMQKTLVARIDNDCDG